MSWKMHLELMQWHRGRQQELQEEGHKFHLLEVMMNFHVWRLLLVKTFKLMREGLEWECLLHKVLQGNKWDHQVHKVLEEVCQSKANKLATNDELNWLNQNNH